LINSGDTIQFQETVFSLNLTKIPVEGAESTISEERFLKLRYLVKMPNAELI
jgi:hypothetical protein